MLKKSKCKLISKEYNSNKDKLSLNVLVITTIFLKQLFINLNIKIKRQCNECNRIRWDITMIRDFVNKYSNCELISTEFINVDEKLKFICECGIEFQTTWDRFKGKKKTKTMSKLFVKIKFRKCKEYFDKK